MSTYQRIFSQPEALPSPVADLASTMTAERDAPWHSALLQRFGAIHPENHDRLLADLRERTGLPVTRIEIGRIDFLRDVAEIQVYYQHDPATQSQRSSLSPGPMAASK